MLLGYLSLELGSQGSLGLLGTDVYSIGKMLDSSVVQNTGQLTDGLCWGLWVMSLRLGSLGPLGFFSGPEWVSGTSWVSRVSLRVLWGLGPLGCLSAPGRGLSLTLGSLGTDVYSIGKTLDSSLQGWVGISGPFSCPGCRLRGLWGLSLGGAGTSEPLGCLDISLWARVGFLSEPGWSVLSRTFGVTVWAGLESLGSLGTRAMPQRPQVATESDPKGLSLAGVFRDNVQFPVL